MRECFTYLLTRAGQLALLTDAIIQLNRPIREEYIWFNRDGDVCLLGQDSTTPWCL